MSFREKSHSIGAGVSQMALQSIGHKSIISGRQMAGLADPTVLKHGTTMAGGQNSHFARTEGFLPIGSAHSISAPIAG
jgi:hypothetical protein